MRKENRGGARAGAGRPAGKPQPHLRSPNARRNRVAVSVSDKELQKLFKHALRTGAPVATALYDLAKKGGL